jgi:outer membrane protein OmpA-like peptidoglycan-associated protein
MGRADSVKSYLTRDGRVDAERITAVGLGETQPIVKDGANKEEQNRRIDVIIKTN